MSEPAGSEPRLLVIRGGAIGDFILTLPAIRLLREAFPKAHLEILGYQHIIALADGRFYADRTRSIEYGPVAAFFSRHANFDGALAAYFASFQQIVSYLYDPDSIFDANLRRAGAKNILHAFRKIDDSNHAARQLAQPLEALALYLDDAAPRLFPNAADAAAASAFFQDEEGPWVALHPGSGSSRKNWLAQRWVEVAAALVRDDPRRTLLLIGGEADQAAFTTFQRAWSGPPLRLAHGMPLPQLAAILARCQLFLGHDSGISHLAAAVGTRCLLLFGPTDPEVWAPPAAHVRVLRSPDGDLTALNAETVLAAARGLLAQPLR